eukprot:g83343.t1
MSQVNIPPETKKRYDLADRDLESLAPGHWYAYKNGMLDKGNAKPWDDALLGEDVPVQKRARKPTSFLNPEPENPKKKLKIKDAGKGEEKPESNADSEGEGMGNEADFHLCVLESMARLFTTDDNKVREAVLLLNVRLTNYHHFLLGTATQVETCENEIATAPGLFLVFPPDWRRMSEQTRNRGSKRFIFAIRSIDADGDGKADTLQPQLLGFYHFNYKRSVLLEDSPLDFKTAAGSQALKQFRYRSSPDFEQKEEKQNRDHRRHGRRAGRRRRRGTRDPSKKIAKKARAGGEEEEEEVEEEEEHPKKGKVAPKSKGSGGGNKTKNKGCEEKEEQEEEEEEHPKKGKVTPKSKGSGGGNRVKKKVEEEEVPKKLEAGPEQLSMDKVQSAINLALTDHTKPLQEMFKNSSPQS